MASINTFFSSIGGKILMPSNTSTSIMASKMTTNTPVGNISDNKITGNTSSSITNNMTSIATSSTVTGSGSIIGLPTHQTLISTKKDSLNCTNLIKFYINKILNQSKSNGEYCMLVLDDKTSEIISVIYNMRKLVETDIVSVLNIKNEIKSKYDFKSIVFISPTEESINLLKTELSNQNFTEYYLFFSSEISDEKLKKIALSDQFNLVKSVIEFNCEFVALTSALFTLNMDYNPFITEQNIITKINRDYVDKMTLGLTNLLLSIKTKPDICFSPSIDSAQILSQSLSEIIQTKREKFYFNNGTGEPSLLLILDRCQDPITPLLTKWTYQSMIHEFIELKNNICNVNYEEKVETFSLSETEDNFYSHNMYSNYGFFCESINKYVEELKKEKKELIDSCDIDKLRKTIQVIPEITKKTEIMNKHMIIIAKLLEIVTKRNLLKISEIEQRCIKDANIVDDYKALCEIILNKENSTQDVLRVTLIYILRHEIKKEVKIEEIKTMLIGRGIKLEELEVIDILVKYFINKSKKSELFSTSIFYDKFTNIFDSSECENLLTQNKPLVCDILEQIAKNKLNNSKYLIKKINNVNSSKIHSQTVTQINNQIPYSKIIIFIIGGCTYEEVAKIQMIKHKLPFEIIIGGTTVLNSTQFINNIKSFS
jgi:vacuolar protein sorting-associated protein 45